MKRAYIYKLHPTVKQQNLLSQFFGCTRFIYNWGLDKKITAYKEKKKSIGYIQLAKELTLLKQAEDHKWLNDCPSVCLQQSLRNLDNAYTNFFKQKKGFPKFKSRHKSKDVCKFINSVHINFDTWKVKVPKVGWVKLCRNKSFDINQVKLGTLTVSRDNLGTYWCSILVDDGKPNSPKAKVKEETSVGIDLGIKEFAILSDGTRYANPKYYEQAELRLKHLQREFSRAKKGSKRYERKRKQVAKWYKKVSNKRLDFCQKLSTQLIREYDTICLEDLNVKGMMQNHHLAKAISSVSWSTFKSMLEYKAEWYGKNIITIGRFEPSSKMCNHCGHINKDLELKDRTWTCPNCGEVIDRDLNAAKNIRDFAIHPQSLITNSMKNDE